MKTIGDIKAFSNNQNHDGYIICDGRSLPIDKNIKLYMVIGTSYGNKDEKSFCIPDLRADISNQKKFYICIEGNLPNITINEYGE